MYIPIHMYTYNRLTSIGIDLSKIKLFVFIFVLISILINRLKHGCISVIT